MRDIGKRKLVDAILTDPSIKCVLACVKPQIRERATGIGGVAATQELTHIGGAFIATEAINYIAKKRHHNEVKALLMHLN